MNLLEIMRTSPVIPVIAIDALAHAVPLAKALVAGGIRVLEVTLRTVHGLPAIRAIAASQWARVSALLYPVSMMVNPSPSSSSQRFTWLSAKGRRMRNQKMPGATSSVAPGSSASWG